MSLLIHPLPQPLSPLLPDHVEQGTHRPHDDQHHSRHGRKHGPAHEHEAADHRKDDGDDQKRLIRPAQARLAEAKHHGAEDGQEEEGVLAQAVEGEQGAEVPEEDEERGEERVEEDGVEGRVGDALRFAALRFAALVLARLLPEAKVAEGGEGLGKPVCVGCCDGHAARDEGVAQQGAGYDEADEDRGHDSEAAAEEPGDCGLKTACRSVLR